MANADQLYAKKQNLWVIDMDPGSIFGVGSRKLVGEELKNYGATNVLLFYDEAMGKLGHTDELLEIIRAAGLKAEAVQVPLGEPTSTKCNEIVDSLNGKTFDGIVALGGGSCMDYVKMAGLILMNGGRAEDYLGYTNKNLEATKIFRPMFCLPTTSGTGAEVSTNLAMNDDAKGIKSVGKHQPTLAILDPYYTIGLPASVTAATGMDALAHCYDSLTNTAPMQNWMADTLGMEGIRTAFEYLPRAVKNGNDIEARARMSYASLIGGYILKFRRCSWGHSFANKISDRYHLPHGVAISLALWGVCRYNVTQSPETNLMTARALGIPGSDPVALGREIVKRMDDLHYETGMKTMKEAGLDKAFLENAISLIRQDTKWKVAAAPNFDVLEESIYEAFEL